MKPQTEVRKLFIQLTGQFSTIHPCLLQLTKNLPDGDWGDTGVVRRKGKPYLLIRVSTKLSLEAMTMVLLHEYAHAMEWRPEHQHDSPDHGAAWGLAVSRVESWYAAEVSDA